MLLFCLKSQSLNLKRLFNLLSVVKDINGQKESTGPRTEGVFILYLSYMTKHDVITM